MRKAQKRILNFCGLEKQSFFSQDVLKALPIKISTAVDKPVDNYRLLREGAFNLALC
jgi:hypothetical protein